MAVQEIVRSELSVFFCVGRFMSRRYRRFGLDSAKLRAKLSETPRLLDLLAPRSDAGINPWLTEPSDCWNMSLDYDTNLTQQIIGLAMRVHSALGPGLLESAYERCLCHEFEQNGVAYARQVELPLVYRGVRLDCGYRADIVVGDEVLVEVKAVEAITSLHEAQLLTYLRLSACQVGLLLNFNTVSLKDGFRRRVNSGG
jgi:GxxExxY protein